MTFVNSRLQAQSFVLSCLLVWQTVALPAAAQAPSAAAQVPSTAAQSPSESKLQIAVVEGEGVVHSIKESQPRNLIVRVEDETGRPVAGAAVTFLLPELGASGTFPDGKTSLSTVTDQKGEAIARGLRPNSAQGTFQIRVTVSSEGRTANATINQTNAMSVNAPARRSGSGKWIAILAIVGGAGGALAASRAGSKGGPAAPPAPGTTPGVVITPGTPTVGGPR